MDIPLLTGVAGPRAAPQSRSASAQPDADFAGSLARAASGRPESATGVANADKPYTALTALAMALEKTALGKVSLQRAELNALHDAMKDGDLDAIKAALTALDAEVTQSDGQALLANGPVLAQQLAALGHALAQGLPQATASPPEVTGSASGGDGDAWAAVRERLALIEQAGRPAMPERHQANAITGVPAPPASARLDAREALAHRAAPASTQSSAVVPRASLESADRASVNSVATSLNDNGRAGPATAMEPPLQPVMNNLPSTRDEATRTAGLELASHGHATNTPGSLSTPASGAAQAPQAALSAPLTSPAWPQQLGQQLIRMSRAGGEQRVELQLHPAELGPLSVSLRLGDQGAQAQLLSAHAQVRQVLEQAIPQLREALAEQGIQLGEATVGEQREGAGEHGLAQDDGQSRLAGMDTPADEAPADSVQAVVLEGRVSVYA